MNYLHTSRVTWVATSERLTSGGDHLCTDSSPAAAATSAPSGSPAEATTSAPTARQQRWPPLPRRLASGGNHLCAGQPPQWWQPPQCAHHGEEALTPALLRGEDKTIQAMELGAQRQAVLAVWPGPRSRSLPPSQGW
jgi:hypothetical protein